MKKIKILFAAGLISIASFLNAENASAKDSNPLEDITTISIDLASNSADLNEFIHTPFSYLNEHIDIQSLCDAKKLNGSVKLLLNSDKGKASIVYDKNGEITHTYLKFENILPSRDIMHKLYKEHKGWEITENRYVARGKNGKISTRNYWFKMEKNGETKTVKYKV